jgi:hypothetical protein
LRKTAVFFAEVPCSKADKTIPRLMLVFGLGHPERRNVNPTHYIGPPRRFDT